MAELKYSDTNKYYWCAWGGDICHFGILREGQKVSTGQDNLETFSTESELEAKVDSLKGSGYYNKKDEHDRYT